METLLGRHWHRLDAGEVVELLNSDPQRGLDRLTVARRREQFGPNLIPARSSRGAVARFLSQFHQALVYLLLAAALVTWFLGEWVDSLVIFLVVVANAVIGFVQEAKAVRALEALAKTMTTAATVIRAGSKEQVAAEDLVPGDLVALQAGDKVPADLRLTLAADLHLDESALTGESTPVNKHFGRIDVDVQLADRRNMAYSSSLVSNGIGTGVVVATGRKTELGRISNLIAEASELATPLTNKIRQFSSLLLIVILALAALSFVVGWLRGEGATQMFLTSVALAVGAVPEGLPAAVTITLAIGVHRMAKRHAIVRNLPTVETLGSTTVICTDKTGTLTENQMTVREIWTVGGTYRVTGRGLAVAGEILPDRVEGADPRSDQALAACLTAGMLCNDSHVAAVDGRWTAHGDPTEAALLVAAAKFGMNEEILRQNFPRLDVLPFESERQYMATLHNGHPSGTETVFVKGAIERIASKCKYMLRADGQSAELDQSALMATAQQMGERGMRVLAFARASRTRSAAPFDLDGLQDLTLLGLQGMLDPPRAEAVIAVRACQRAGVAVKMITGDYPATAASIARQSGLAPSSGDGRHVMLTGENLAKLTDDELVNAVQRTDLFARVSPEQKLRLVQALQACGQVVAMTGDGVNDAPALKQANIGVAMGVAGTEVAKEAADIVLTDDNFATIEAAIEEGRGVFDNLTKFIVWTLPTNLGEGLVVLAAVMAGVTLPILPLQILWINLTTAVLLGLMLAFEPKETGIMSRAPRAPGAPLLTPKLLARIGLVGTLLLIGVFGLFEWKMSQDGGGRRGPDRRGERLRLRRDRLPP